MAVSRIHGPYAVEIGATLLGGITQQRVNTGTTVTGENVSDEAYTRHQSITAQNPEATFTTMHLAAALAACGLTGTSIADMTGGLKLYAQKRAEGGTRTTGSAHRKYTLTEGILYPVSLAASHQGNATIDYRAVATYDGSNNPVAEADSQALPSGLTDAERFTIGPVTLGGISLPQIRDLRIDFGITVMAEGADSDVWPTHASITAINPSLTLTGIDIEWLKSTNIPLTGASIAHATTTIYLRKRSQGGTFVANGTAEHIKFTAAGLAYIDDAISAQSNQTGTCSLTMPLRYDGTNAPLTINTASAIA